MKTIISLSILFVAVILGALFIPNTLPFLFLGVSLLIFIVVIPRIAADRMPVQGTSFHKTGLPIMFRDAFIVLVSLFAPALVLMLVGIHEPVFAVFEWTSYGWLGTIEFTFHSVALIIAVEFVVRIVPMLLWRLPWGKLGTYIFILCASAASAVLSGTAWILWILPSILLSIFAILEHSPKRQLLLRIVVQLGALAAVAPIIRGDDLWLNTSSITWILIIGSVICIAGSIYLSIAATERKSV